MGFNISWLAFNGVPKHAVLAAMSLRDTQVPDEVPESAFACAELPTGWTLLVAQDFDFAFSPAAIKAASEFAVLALQVHEGIMYSHAAFRLRGVPVWDISHYSENGLHDLKVEGEPPPEFDAIKAAGFEEQRKSDTESANAQWKVDHIHGIPIALAAAQCGYSHDRWSFDWGQPEFTEAEPI